LENTNSSARKSGSALGPTGGSWGEQADNDSIAALNRALDLLEKLHHHNWRRGFWYGGK
jgi:hypothetical protein